VRRRKAAAAALGLAIAGVANLAAIPEAVAQATQPTLEGVWTVRRHGADCATGQVFPGPGFPAFMSFTRDGLLVSYSIGPGSTPANGGIELGVWKREPGPGNYSFHLTSPDYDASGAFDGSADISAFVTLTDGGTTFHYSAVIKGLDPSGATLFQFCGAANGVRFQ
jgi:hypothetical protein